MIIGERESGRKQYAAAGRHLVDYMSVSVFSCQSFLSRFYYYPLILPFAFLSVFQCLNNISNSDLWSYVLLKRSKDTHITSRTSQLRQK